MNRKLTEIVVRLPAGIESLDQAVREKVSSAIFRGRAEVAITVNSGAGTGATAIDSDAARMAHAQLVRLHRELGLAGGISISDIIRIPGVLASPTADFVQVREQYWPGVEAALATALADLEIMRVREGEALSVDLGSRIALMRAALGRIQAEAPGVRVKHRDVLLERIRQAGLEGIDGNDERILKELVLFADRSDISEEMVRLASHFAQYEECAASRDAVGRKLDFLAQEMNREINTIGSKANDARIAADVVILKTELERFREQVQNVE